MGEFPINLIAKITSSNRLGEIFTEGNVYKAQELGNTLMIKDNMGCIRHIHGEWKKDTQFKEMFKVLKEAPQDAGTNSVRTEGDRSDK